MIVQLVISFFAKTQSNDTCCIYINLWRIACSTKHTSFLFFISILCISIGAGASGAINMWYDRDIDSLMERTKKDQFQWKS